MQQIIWNIQVLQKKALEMGPQGFPCVLSNFSIIPNAGVLSKLHNLYHEKHIQVHLYWWLALHIDGLGWTAFDQISLSICEVCLPNLVEFDSSPHLAKSAAIYNSLPITMIWHHWKMKCE